MNARRKAHSDAGLLPTRVERALYDRTVAPRYCNNANGGNLRDGTARSGIHPQDRRQCETVRSRHGHKRISRAALDTGAGAGFD